MDALVVLENKISELIELVGKLKKENAALAADKEQLCEQLAMMESFKARDRESLNQEKELTKLAVDALIKNIDALVDGVAD
jgi:regulator of replication initiation timing